VPKCATSRAAGGAACTPLQGAKRPPGAARATSHAGAASPPAPGNAFLRRPGGCLHAFCPGPTATGAHTLKRPPPARNSSTQHVLERLRLRALPRSITSQTSVCVSAAQSPQGTSPQPASRHLAARAAAPLICTPPARQPTTAATHAASAPCLVLPARAPRAVAQRGGGSAPARCGGAVGGQRASPKHRLAASCSDARLRFLPVPAQVGCCAVLRGAFRARSAAQPPPAAAFTLG